MALEKESLKKGFLLLTYVLIAEFFVVIYFLVYHNNFGRGKKLTSKKLANIFCTTQQNKQDLKLDFNFVENQFPANFGRPLLNLLTNSSDSHIILTLHLSMNWQFLIDIKEVFLFVESNFFLSQTYILISSGKKEEIAKKQLHNGVGYSTYLDSKPALYSSTNLITNVFGVTNMWLKESL
ncbi:hypothetical protein BpHYR1_022482 [Brachionus plicatilis]|uniref:Uncharacterized protein n=1 Tax=Brachionus plicatilis TaxID=10195 RepID=A0A3M7Q066_BRAPC|nr:hypothetical protein BpHYR1_022482 [Brachionus plicatilis]